MKHAQDILVADGPLEGRETLAERLIDIDKDFKETDTEIEKIKKELGLIPEEKEEKEEKQTLNTSGLVHQRISNRFYFIFRPKTIAERIKYLESNLENHTKIQNLILKHLGLEFTKLVKEEKEVLQKVKIAKKNKQNKTR